MQREIKFRVWDIDNKRMIEFPHRFYYDNIKKCYVYYETWYDDEDGKKFRCNIMQFTGLYDKNGKEIYEGDIVAISKLSHKHIIEWDEFDCSFKTRNEDGTLSLLYKQDMNNLFKVIGNIYENSQEEK